MDVTEPHTAVVLSDPPLRRDKIRVPGVWVGNWVFFPSFFGVPPSFLVFLCLCVCVFLCYFGGDFRCAAVFVFRALARFYFFFFPRRWNEQSREFPLCLALVHGEAEAGGGARPQED